MCKSHRLSEQILRCHFFAASYTKIFYSSYNVPDALTPQTFLTETCWGPKTPPAGTGTLASSPATSRSPARPRPADPRTRHAPARTDPRGPEPAGGGVLRRARLAPGVRGPAQREGSGPRAPRFSKTPTWRRPPPPATTTPPAAPTAQGPRGGAPGKFRFSSPGPPGAGGRPTRASPTRPGAGGGDESPTPPRPGRRARTLPAPPPRPPRVCAARPRAAGQIWSRRTGGRPAQPLAGDSPAPPAEPRNGRLGWPFPCARTGAPPPTRQARARGHEHTHTARAPPFLAGSLAPPVPPCATRSRGRGHRGATPTWAAGAWGWFLRAVWARASRSPVGAGGTPFLAGVVRTGSWKGLFISLRSSSGDWKNGRKAGHPLLHHRTGLPRALKNFLQPGKKGFGFRYPKASGQTFVCCFRLPWRSSPSHLQFASLKPLPLETEGAATAIHIRTPRYSAQPFLLSEWP